MKKRSSIKLGITKKWVVQNVLPPQTRRRTPHIQEAFDFFVALPVGSSALVPHEERSTARTAASDYSSHNPGFVIRFRREQPGSRLRCWKEVVKATPAT